MGSKGDVLQLATRMVGTCSVQDPNEQIKKDQGQVGAN